MLDNLLFGYPPPHKTRAHGRRCLEARGKKTLIDLFVVLTLVVCPDFVHLTLVVKANRDCLGLVGS